MIVTLPLPSRITQYFPERMVSVCQWFAFWSFSGLLTIPWLFCIYQLVTHELGRNKRIKEALNEDTAPKVVIVMPCYKEEPQTLLAAIDSVVDCDYPPSCIHVFVSFDGIDEDDLYIRTVTELGVSIQQKSYPRSIDISYKSARVTISRFPHGGKRKCQKSTFRLIDKIYTEYLLKNDDLFILFIDSDCILDRVCLQNFVYDMELSPGNNKEMLAMTGVITTTTKKHTLITLLQDIEYIHGQLYERTIESGCGAVTCLPGALTMLRFSAFRRMAKQYFADKAEQCLDLFDYGKCHLGEDRWLTHLFMIGARQPYRIQMCTSAFCKTEAVQTYKSLLKQRRRWFLGFITNEVCMLTDIRIWKKYPVLALVRFMQNTIRTTALLFLILVISILTTAQTISGLPVGFIAVSLGLNWIMMIYFGAKLRRYKTWLYPLMFILNPIFNWCYMVYGVCTAGQRTWGGPRADAAAADVNTSAQQAIEKAVAAGDDLNVVPETFNRFATRSVPLLPPGRLEGRFTAAERLPGGWYEQGNESMLTLGTSGGSIMGTPLGTSRPFPRRPRDSFESYRSALSGINTTIMSPGNEDTNGEDDLESYHQTSTVDSSPNDLGKEHRTSSSESLEFNHAHRIQNQASNYNSLPSGDVFIDIRPASPPAPAAPLVQASSGGHQPNQATLTHARLLRNSSSYGLEYPMDGEWQPHNDRRGDL